MIKIVVEIKENKKDSGESSNVTLKAMDTSKGTKQEKATGNVVFNEIASALEKLKDAE